MLIGQRVCWLVPGKNGVVTRYNQLKQTVDLRFEDDDRSERGDIPICEVVSIEQGASEPPSAGKRKRRSKPPAIDSQERFGRPSLGGDE